MEPITGNLLAINQQIAHAARDAGRDPDEITLIAASKTQPGTVIQQAYEAGIRHFGENYLDEALAKRADLATPDLIWHFIGKIQSNKTKSIAQHFDWVHTIDRYKIAKRLSDQRSGSKLNALIQVNIDADIESGGLLLMFVVAEICRSCVTKWGRSSLDSSVGVFCRFVGLK